VPGVFQNIDLPPPSPPSECVLPPHQRREVHTRQAVRGVGGVNILEDASHRIGLLQSNLSTYVPNGWINCPAKLHARGVHHGGALLHKLVDLVGVAGAGLKRRIVIGWILANRAIRKADDRMLMIIEL
jgi:hypothetical protein